MKKHKGVPFLWNSV